MVSTAMTIAYPCPPTTNILDSHQRARLMRSTRKLGAILGTTPYLLEGDIPITLLPIGGNKKPMSKALKRQGSIFTHHQAQSQSVTSLSSVSTVSLHGNSPLTSQVSLPKSATSCMQSAESMPVTPPGLSSHIRSRSSAEKPRPLYLRLNTVPVSPTDGRFPTSLPPTPTSRASISHFPPSPSSPSFATPDIAEIRRKRMAKLARTLGENIPTELVFAPEAKPTKPAFPTPDDEMKRRKRRSMSVSHAYPQDAPFAQHNVSLSRPKQDWVGEWNRNDIREVQKELRNLKAR